MPRPKLEQTKVPIALRVSPETLTYLKKLANESNRPLSNLIEFIIYQHSNKKIPEPIPYYIGAPTQKKQKTKSKPLPLVNDSIAKISEPEPIEPIEIRRNPYAKD